MKKYTISTFIFDTKKEAEEQILKWANTDQLADKSKVFEVSEIYAIAVKKVVSLKKL